MTTHRKAQARPAIQIRETDAERISNLAIEAEDRLPQVAELLLAEINRATIVEDSRLPQNVVALQSTVKFLDEASGIERTLQLVYPQHADIACGTNLDPVTGWRWLARPETWTVDLMARSCRKAAGLADP